MKRSAKHIIAKLLLVIFLVPIVAKIGDSLFHEHQYVICFAKTEKHLHKYKKDCVISTFTFSTFLVNNVFYKLTFYAKISSFLSSFYTKKHLQFTHYLFLLRAPPTF